LPGQTPGYATVPQEEEVTKRELIKELATRYQAQFTPPVAERVVTTFFEGIVQALARGERIEVRGFGCFTVKGRPAAVRRDPRTGARVVVPAQKLPVFKAAKGLRRRLNKP
jgi:integration host factor subunit beta